MHIILEILYAVFESVVYEALAYLPKKIYRSLITLIYGPDIAQDSKRIHWLPRYTLGISSVLLAIGIISACVLLAYRAILAVQS